MRSSLLLGHFLAPGAMLPLLQLLVLLVLPLGGILLRHRISIVVGAAPTAISTP